MKKLAAISFLLLLLFNLFGYRILFYYAQQQSDSRLEASLDKNLYNEADLITIKIPLSLPYQTDQKDFEHIDGEVNFNGTIYKYVKRKVTGGQLVLLCLPDHKKMQLESAKEDFFKNSSDVAAANGSKKSEKSKSAFNTIAAEYESLHCIYTTAAFRIICTERSDNNLVQLLTAPHISPEQPPETV